MGYTKAGGIKRRQNMIKRLGGEEAYREYMRSISTKGGKNSSGYKFGHGKVDPSIAGKLGVEARKKNRNSND